MGLHYLKDEYIKVDNLNIRCWRQGTQGEPVLFIHGIGAAVEYWTATLPAIGSRYRCLAIDLPGFGKSSKPAKASYDLNYYLNFLLRLTEKEQFNPCHVVAHSLGGALALRFATAQPKRVKSLTLLDNVGFGQEISIFYRILSLPYLGPYLLDANPKNFAKALRYDVFNPASLPNSFIERMYPLSMDPMTRRTTLTILKNNLNLRQIKTSALKPLWDDIHQIQHIPTQIFWGKNDPVLPYQNHTQAAQKLLPHAELISLEACGHIPQLEHSQVINDKLLQFLSKNQSHD